MKEKSLQAHRCRPHHQADQAGFLATRGLYRDCIGLYSGYTGIMEMKLVTTIPGSQKYVKS